MSLGTVRLTRTMSEAMLRPRSTKRMIFTLGKRGKRAQSRRMRMASVLFSGARGAWSRVTYSR